MRIKKEIDRERERNGVLGVIKMSENNNEEERGGGGDGKGEDKEE